MNITLDDKWQLYLQGKVQQGGYPSESAVIEEALRQFILVENEFEENKEHYRAALQEGLDDLENGRYIEFNSSDELKEYLLGIHAEFVQSNAEKKTAHG